MPRISATPDDITITIEVNQPLSGGREGPLAQQVLGYIQFNKVQGSAEFTNFDSTLDDRCLELGHTTKKKDHRLAGGHGEGLKIAALVLCRENHHVKISANRCHWHFGFNGQSKANFFCRLTPARVKREPSGPSDAVGCTKLSARTGEDVSVTIEKGQKGRPLSPHDLAAWMRDTIDLHPPSGRIRTASGDLLLEPMYQGHLYERSPCTRAQLGWFGVPLRLQSGSGQCGSGSPAPGVSPTGDKKYPHNLGECDYPGRGCGPATLLGTLSRLSVRG